MATAAGLIGGNASSSSSSSSWIHFKVKKNKNNKPNRVTISCSSSSLIDPYKTLRIRPGASEYEVKKAFRQLALQYHPDVCRGSNCGVQFQTINEAYDIVMSSLRGETDETEMMYDDGDESMRGMNDPDWELWEEWMGWEGAGIRDYTSHINPYI
ncbi:chaperone protein dnaJ 8, chloroplastic [Carica papaya]|uniref:chaperone protein dnaJ 8, chloroplastic n=1 Tax=Carica papaya TaxID=3649 RepID=UPI000B8C74A0|nr:chaperone protein dnaJ 8, chloroplastic [Carica papaya]